MAQSLANNELNIRGLNADRIQINFFIILSYY